VDYPPTESGIAIACRRITKNISNKVEVHVLTYGTEKDNFLVNKPRSISSTKEENVFVHRISPFSGNLMSVPAQEIQNMCYYLEKLDKKHKFDMFHGFNLTGSGYAAVFMAKKLKKRSIVSIRGNDIGRDVFDTSKLYSLKWILENANGVTSVTKDLLLLAENIAKIKTKLVIKNTIDPEEFNEEIKKLKLDGTVICFNGIVRRKKGFGYLLLAFKKFLEKYKGTLLVIGEFMPEEKMSYLRMIDELGLVNNIMITGKLPHETVLNYIKLADVFVLPAVSEGSSNALLEAMYCKVPVIATRLGGAKDIIKHNKDGILIEPHSSESIYKAIVKLRNKRLRTKISAAAYEKVLSNSPGDETKAWVRFYKKCLK